MNEKTFTFSPWNILAGLLLLIVTLALTGLNETLRVLDEERWKIGRAHV